MKSLPSTAELLKVATYLAHAGGRRTLAWFQNALTPEIKQDGTPVTLADRDAEAYMRTLLREIYPNHGIVGEEYGETRGSEPIRWVFDPIDGTKTFVRGVPLYGTLVGVEVEGRPTVGAIYMPALDEMVAAGLGLGCTWNGRACRVSQTTQLSEALSVVTDDVAMRQKLGALGHDTYRTHVGMQRTWADCYGYVLVATGRAEIAMDAKVSIWDCAALMPIIEEAGGRFTDWSGEARIDGGDAIATNGLLHDEALRLFRTI